MTPALGRARRGSGGNKALALFVSYSDFTSASITHCRDALSGGKLILLARLEELVRLLETDAEVGTWLEEKRQAAILHKNPLFSPQLT